MHGHRVGWTSEGPESERVGLVKSQWTTWILVAGAVLWLALSGGLGLLFIVAPIAVFFSYITARAAKKRENRI